MPSESAPPKNLLVNLSIQLRQQTVFAVSVLTCFVRLLEAMGRELLVLIALTIGLFVAGASGEFRLPGRGSLLIIFLFFTIF